LLAISKTFSKPLRLRLDSPAMSPGYDNKAPMTLPLCTGSSSIRLSGFSLHSNRQTIRSRHTFESDWLSWLSSVYPSLFPDDDDYEPFASHHCDFWEWVWEIERGVRPPPFVGIWARGGAKSSSAEMAAVALGATGRRRYGLYISGTQEQAEQHLDAIAASLESPEIAAFYPEMASRAVNKYGSSRGWRRNRLTTASGFVIDAVGLRTGTRGVKFEDQRPDFIILDDVDELSDTPDATAKKIEVFTKTLLPAGSTDLATLAIQNLIIPDGLFSRLAPDAHEPAPFLADRKVSGPVPAIEGLEYEERDGRVYIVGGKATWAGQSRDTAQQQVNDWGIDAFLAEAQHEPRKRGAKLYDLAWWAGQNRYDPDDPALANRTVARFMSWDTAESLAETAAYTACVTGDLIEHGNGYVLLIRDVWRGRVEIPALQDTITDHARRMGFGMQRRDWHYGVIVEYASSGKGIVQAARSNVRTLRSTMPDWLSSVLQGFTPKIPKDQRAMFAARFCRSGRVWLPTHAPWLYMLEQELGDLPHSRYRDMSDAAAQLILSLSTRLSTPDDSTPYQEVA